MKRRLWGDVHARGGRVVAFDKRAYETAHDGGRHVVRMTFDAGRHLEALVTVIGPAAEHLSRGDTGDDAG